MIDSKDSLLIDELKKNSRQTVREIAKKTRLKPSTVHLRMQRLFKEGIIDKYTLKLDNRKAGQNFIVFILVSTSRNIPSSFFQKECIREVFGITGEYDLILKCKFRDIEQFNSFVLDFRNYPQIKKTLTMVATLELKEEL